MKESEKEVKEYKIFDSENEKNDFKLILSELFLNPLKDEMTTELKILVDDIKDKQEKMAIIVEKNNKSLDPLIELMSDFAKGLQEFQTRLQNVEDQNNNSEKKLTKVLEKVEISNQAVSSFSTNLLEKKISDTELFNKSLRIGVSIKILLIINLLVLLGGIIILIIKNFF